MLKQIRNVPLVWLRNTQMQKDTNVNSSQQMHILTKQAALARTKTKQAAMYPETAEYVANYILR